MKDQYRQQQCVPSDKTLPACFWRKKESTRFVESMMSTPRSASLKTSWYILSFIAECWFRGKSNLKRMPALNLSWQFHPPKINLAPSPKCTQSSHFEKKIRGGSLKLHLQTKSKDFKNHKFRLLFLQKCVSCKLFVLNKYNFENRIICVARK